MRVMKTRMVMVAVLLAVTLGWATDKHYANLSFKIVRATNGKPVRNASVILHAVSKGGKQEKSDLQLKTNGDGEASIDGIRYGTLRIQVVAPGFQTYGEDYEIKDPTQEIVIKLDRPKEQYSIYDEHPKAEEKPAVPAPSKDAQQKPEQGETKK